MLIGIHGAARSGKDTFGNLLKAQLPDHEKYSFAKPIKEACNNLFDWDERHSDGVLKEVVDPYWGFSPRFAYQTLGTQWGRDLLHPEIWILIAKQRLIKFNYNMIIPDVRFDNEAEFILKNNGLLLIMHRTGADGKVGIQGHASEAGLSAIYQKSATHIENNGSLEDLAHQAHQLADRINQTAASVVLLG